MINYILVFEQRYNDIIPINIPVSNPHDITEIDKFTRQFNDEEELKDYLVEINVCDENEFQFPICLYYIDSTKSKKPIKLRQNVVYKDDAKYLEPEYIKSVLMKLKDEKEILNHIANKFGNTNKYSKALNIIGQYIYDLKNKDYNVLNVIDYLTPDERRSLGLFIEDEINTINMAKVHKNKELIKVA